MDKQSFWDHLDVLRAAIVKSLLYSLSGMVTEADTPNFLVKLSSTNCSGLFHRLYIPKNGNTSRG